MNINVRVCLGLAGVVLAAAGALASPTYAGHIQFADSYGSIGGGEFRGIPQPDFTITPARTGTPFQGGVASTPPQFETFCIEKFEGLEFALPQPDYKADLNTETVSQDAAYAGGAHGGFNDPLDARTAYLYAHFIGMSLATPYDYANEGNRIVDANSLQTAIWFIEQEDATPLSGKALAFCTEAGNAVSSGAWSGIGDVRILNIYTNSARVDYQDVLVVTSGGIPAPAGAAALGLGLCSLGLRRRR